MHKIAAAIIILAGAILASAALVAYALLKGNDQAGAGIAMMFAVGFIVFGFVQLLVPEKYFSYRASVPPSTDDERR